MVNFPSSAVSDNRTSETIATLSYAKAIQICEDKHPHEFRKKKLFTLAIAVAGIAMLVIPAIALAISALAICSFEIALLTVAPLALIGISFLVKKINDKTLYWSGELAKEMLKQEEESNKKAKAKINKS